MGHAASWQAADSRELAPWAEPGCKHWLLRDPHLWPDPVPAKGDLGLWNYPRE